MVKLRKSTLPFTKGLARSEISLRHLNGRATKIVRQNISWKSPGTLHNANAYTSEWNFAAIYLFRLQSRRKLYTSIIKYLQFTCMPLVSSYWTSSPLYTMCTQPLLSSENYYNDTSTRSTHVFWILGQNTFHVQQLGIVAQSWNLSKILIWQKLSSLTKYWNKFALSHSTIMYAIKHNYLCLLPNPHS